ncbi:MAG: hypothetical protein ACC683_11110, partial [Acidimicrobiia bacterium]
MPIDNDQDLAATSVETTEAAQESPSDTEAATPETEAAQPMDAVDAVEAVEAVEETVSDPAIEAVTGSEESNGSASEEPEENGAPEATDTPEKTPEDMPTPRGERPAISAPKEIADVPDDLSADDFAAAIEQTVFEFKEGDIVAGTVV